jgi:hypothetical protein
MALSISTWRWIVQHHPRGGLRRGRPGGAGRQVRRVKGLYRTPMTLATQFTSGGS